MEQDGTDTAKVSGTFVSRDTTAQTWVTVDGDVITVTDSSANFFKVGDTIVDNNGLALSIEKVSRDGVNITVDLNTSTGISLNLTNAESAGLIGDANATTTATGSTAVTDLSTTALAY